MSTPLFTIIVPVFNVENYIDVCIESIILQEFSDFEIIIVDDGSTDSSAKKCDEWRERDKRIKVYHKQNGGLSDARNFGIGQSTGKYIWYVDSDDWIDKKALLFIYDCLCKYPKTDAVAVQLLEHRSDIVTLHGKKSYPTEYASLSNQEYLQKGYDVMPSVRYITKRSILVETNLRFIKGVLHEDIPYTHMLLFYLNKIVLLPTPVYYYRIRENSITTQPNIRSCYSLIVSYKEIVKFVKNNLSDNDKKWYISLFYDYFYEINLRLYSFRGKSEYDIFLKEHGSYIYHEFIKMYRYLRGKRLALLLIYIASPLLYRYLITKKRK